MGTKWTVKALRGVLTRQLLFLASHDVKSQGITKEGSYYVESQKKDARL